MAVKIRLTRRGRKKLALYDMIVADVRSPRDGRFIEKLGTYNPNTDPATINIDADRAFHWMMVGAQPTDTARRILSYKGVLMRKHLQVGVDKGAITQEEADKRLADWMEQKASQIQNKRDRLAKAKSDSEKARMEAERKVKEARAEAIAKKNVVEEEVAEEATAEAAEEATADAAAEEAVEAAPAAEETPAEEAATEEAPAEDEAKEEAPAAEATEEVTAEEAPAEEATTEEAPAAEAKEEEASDEDDSKEKSE